MIFTLVIQNELACKEPQGRPLSVKEKGLEIMWVVYLLVKYGNIFY